MTIPPKRNSGRAKGRYVPSKDRGPRRERRSGTRNDRPHGKPSRTFPNKSAFRPSDRPSREGRPGSLPGDTISPSRLEAARALYGIEKGSKIADVLEMKRKLIPEDEALLRELVYGCTRQKRLLDHHLGSLCQTPFEKLPVEVKIALRLGLYQLLFLDRVPARAAVHESVNLAKKGGQEALSGFVNAVLRTAENNKASFEAKGESEIDTLALKYSHPTWLVKRWVKSLGAERSEEALKADNQPHSVFLNTAPGMKGTVLEDLGRQNIRLADTAWPPGTLALKSHEGGLFSGESFEKGDWIVQDWVPQAMLEMLPLQQGQRVWDVCAAPGGKTVGLAWKIGPNGQVMASDASAERRKRLIENIDRVGLKQVSVFDHEIQKLSPAQKFDLAWVDAPCSGTGVLSRRADLRWRLIPKDIVAHVDQQRDLLEQAQGHLYPGGHLVYSTCSLEKEENQDIIRAFLKDHPEFTAVESVPPSAYPEILKDEVGSTFLPTAEHDGGFIAVMRK